MGARPPLGYVDHEGLVPFGLDGRDQTKQHQTDTANALEQSGLGEPWVSLWFIASNRRPCPEPGKAQPLTPHAEAGTHPAKSSFQGAIFAGCAIQPAKDMRVAERSMA